MKKIFSNLALFAVLITLLSTVSQSSVSAGSLAAAMPPKYVWFENKAVANAGDVFTVNVMAKSDQPVVGIQFSLQFDPAVVECEDINLVKAGIQCLEEGPWLENVANSIGGSLSFGPYTVNNTAGTINDYAIQIIGFGPTDGATTQDVVATITFRAKADGLSVNSFVNSLILVDPLTNPYAGVVWEAGDIHVGDYYTFLPLLLR